MVSKLCSRSQGQPPGARRICMISTRRAKPWPAVNFGSEEGKNPVCHSYHGDMSVRLAVLGVLLCGAHAYAQGPQPPCGNDPVPAYPRLNDPATVKLWSRSDFGRDWKPPACTGWTSPGFTTLV